ncbi:hypothetical protein CY34DRAFT_786313 [Suillus luteus UH-Slu-Lm8-n1]|uniref:Peptidase C2 calpain domain-containing protein n=1 Tax=Suillus luteus UH-Slu-Lm8-n1 TaxID=930992 RepID=A0A0C9ZAJ3_9AGAM|nr:hypothetical protein CY34DRAFT_786313 [Suillus luteus UH-Slu-Lm8-n1]
MNVQEDDMVSGDPEHVALRIDGVLTNKTAGGNCTHPTYMVNPQYHLRVHNTGTSTSTSIDKRNKTQVILTAQGTRDISLNVTAVWSQGERISELSQKEMVAHSGPYTYGHARVGAHLAPGDYTVVLSAFELDQTGKFTLKVESPSPFEIEAIPQEGAGMYVKTVRGEWDLTTAVGGPSQTRYHRNPVYEVTIPCASEFGYVSLHPKLKSTSFTFLQRPSPTPRSRSRRIHQPLPLPSSSTNLQGCIASSGPYSDALSGVDIPKRSISPGKYYLVPSTVPRDAILCFRLPSYSFLPILLSLQVRSSC